MNEIGGRLLLSLCLAAPISVGLACAEGTASEEGGLLCEPGSGEMCLCPNGMASVEWCRFDGQGFLPCECEAGDEGFGGETGGDGDGDPNSSGDGDGDPQTSGDGDGDPGTGGDGDGDPDPGTTGDGDGDPGTTGDGDGDGDGDLHEACYLGPNEDWSVCFPLAMPAPLPAGYDYPGPYQGNVNYREPVCYLDLDTIDTSAQVAPNFTLGEFVQAYKGRYAVASPAAIARVQDMRDVVGPIIVNSGYRPPGYNAMIGGATHSRHMYGDAFDLDPVDVTLATLESVCTDTDGFLVEYESHVHCDWRFVDVHTGFFGMADIMPGTFGVLAAEVEFEPGTSRLRAPASGFDEGEPLRRWTAFDAEGQVIDEGRGRSYEPPVGAVRVEVIVGAQVRLSYAL